MAKPVNDVIVISIGIMAFLVLIYRVFYIGIPFFKEGIAKKDLRPIMKGLTQFV